MAHWTITLERKGATIVVPGEGDDPHAPTGSTTRSAAAPARCTRRCWTGSRSARGRSGRPDVRWARTLLDCRLRLYGGSATPRVIGRDWSSPTTGVGGSPGGCGPVRKKAAGRPHRYVHLGCHSVTSRLPAPSGVRLKSGKMPSFFKIDVLKTVFYIHTIKSS